MGCVEDCRVEGWESGRGGRSDGRKGKAVVRGTESEGGHAYVGGHPAGLDGGGDRGAVAQHDAGCEHTRESAKRFLIN